MNRRDSISLASIRACFEGAVPAGVATCAVDGTPNVTFASQVFYLDEKRIALSFQFFNKTRQNIFTNPYASVLVVHPFTMRNFRIHIRYLRTETQGPIFEGMKAQLAGIASYTGMADVFHLRGSDIYEVLHVEAIGGQGLPEAPPRSNILTGLRLGSARISMCNSFEELLNTSLAILTDFLGVTHAMVLMLDTSTQRLYTVASCGYATSGVGSEIDMGDGVIGVAARERTPVRINHFTNAYLYADAVRNSMRFNSPNQPFNTDIPYPGLAAPRSQLAVPILSAGKLLGVLFVESPQDLKFSFEDEDALVVVASSMGTATALMQGSPDTAAAAESMEHPDSLMSVRPAFTSNQAPLKVRRFKVNDSIFINDVYLIKGVAGSIFWRLVIDHTSNGRSEFSNRELRLDPSIRLPDVVDNLEARLVLLQRRLAEHSSGIRIEKTGRGKFRLVVPQPLELEETLG